MHIQQTKQRSRSAALERIKQLSATDHAAESRSICKHILQLYPKPSAICAYYPLSTEVDIRPLLVTLLQQGVLVYLPSFNNNNFTFRQITALTELQTGDLNIAEPPKTNKEVNIATIDYVLIPGRAFTKNCYRLGRGNGGYDTWIHGLPSTRPHLIGVSFDCQLLNEIPLEPHDAQLDMVITARETFKH